MARAAPASAAMLRTLVYACCALFCVGWTVALGEDLQWDAVNYQVYLGYSALNDRFAQDFFAAGPPSYITPWPFVPLYLAVAAGAPALALAVALALAHAGVLVLTFELAWVAAERMPTDRRAKVAALAVAIAAANPVFLQILGTTFSDLVVANLVLGGWLAALHAHRRDSAALVIAAGALCGLATSMKLSNGIFAVALLPVLLLAPIGVARRWRRVAAYGIACAFAFALATLPWALELWREFGNPFFPFLNHVFQSPDFTSQPLRYERFLPQTVADALLRPFTLLQASGYVHTEPRAPDLRYAVLLVAVAAWAAAHLRRRSAIAGVESTEARLLAGLLCGLLAAWVLWLASSGNSRYFVAGACVASVALALLWARFHARWRLPAIIALAVLAATQLAQLALGSDLGRAKRPWEGRWLDVEVPRVLADTPYLYLSLGFQTGSAIVPYLHRDSGMINVSGFQVLAPGYAGGERALKAIARNAPRLRMLAVLPGTRADERQAVERVASLGGILARFGLRPDPSDCQFIRIDGQLANALAASSASNAGPGERPRTTFISCALASVPGLAEAYAADVRVPDLVFDRVEDRCPQLFHPRRPATELRAHWVRTYNMGSEVHLWIDGEQVRYFRPVTGGDAVDIGSVDEWLRGGRPFDCSIRSAPAFGGLLLR